MINARNRIYKNLSPVKFTWYNAVGDTNQSFGSVISFFKKPWDTFFQGSILQPIYRFCLRVDDMVLLGRYHTRTSTWVQPSYTFFSTIGGGSSFLGVLEKLIEIFVPLEAVFFWFSSFLLPVLSCFLSAWLYVFLDGWIFLLSFLATLTGFRLACVFRISSLFLA